MAIDPKLLELLQVQLRGRREWLAALKAASTPAHFIAACELALERETRILDQLEAGT